VLILSLVHPDFLPSVYALAQVIRDHGFASTIASFTSLASGRYDPGPGITMVDCGPHAGSSADRSRARRRFRATAARLFEERPVALIAVCPFSYLEALRLARRRSTPVLYFVEEIYEVSLPMLLRSPLSGLRNWRAERALRRAALVAAPSDERAAYIGSRAGLTSKPSTVLNSPYVEQPVIDADDTAAASLLPQRFATGVLVVNTGRVSDTQGIAELVESVEEWPADVRLAVTGVGDDAYGHRVRAAAAASRRRDDICLLPRLSRAAMLGLQKRADIGICLLRRDADPATKMPAPNKVGEYLQWGMLIVASRLPFLDQLEQRGVGEMVDEIDPAEIASAVSRAVARVRRDGTRDHIRGVSRSWLNMRVQAAPILAALDAAAARTA
jgi:glycosyltransferase involved in cell wall biosynthesis